jgi:hypothetical protein
MLRFPGGLQPPVTRRKANLASDQIQEVKTIVTSSSISHALLRRDKPKGWSWLVWSPGITILFWLADRGTAYDSRSW